MHRREFIQSGLIARLVQKLIPPVLEPFMASAVEEPHVSRSIQVNESRQTVLMAHDADLKGDLKQFPGWPKVKFPGNAAAAAQLQRDRSKWPKYSDSSWWVEEWKGPEDQFVWTLDVARPDFFDIWWMGTAREAEVDLVVGDSKLTGWISSGWDVMWDTAHFPPTETGARWRCGFNPPDDYFRFVWSSWSRFRLGSVYLQPGRHTVTLSAAKPPVEAALYSLEFVPSAVETKQVAKAMQLRSSTRWMSDAKYGLFFHWTSSISDDTSASWPRRGPRKPFPHNVDAFNVPAFAKMVAGTGAGYIIFTATWADHCFPAPIQAIDKVLPGRTSQRDLLMEIADELAKYNVRMMLYYHLGVSDSQWWKATEGNFLENWCAIVSEVGQRYGSKLAGWWFDSGEAYYTRSVPFDRCAEAAKHGYPARLVSYNNGNFWPKFTDFQDYVGGEGPHYWVDQSLNRSLPQGGAGIYLAGRQEGLQAHQAFPLESPGWIHNRPNSDIGAPIWDEASLIRRMKDAVERKFVPTLAIEIYEDGAASPQTLALLESVKAALHGS